MPPLAQRIIDLSNYGLLTKGIILLNCQKNQYTNFCVSILRRSGPLLRKICENVSINTYLKFMNFTYRMSIPKKLLTPFSVVTLKISLQTLL